MASSSRLTRVNPELISGVIISTAIILFAITVFGIISITNQKNKDLVNYEFRLILEGNGHYLKSTNKRDFTQKISLKDEEYYVAISELNNPDRFVSGNKKLQADGQCVTQQYFEFDIDFCRPNPIPWDFLKVVSLCFVGIIFISIIVLRYLSSEMVLSFKKLFSTANIPHPLSLNFSAAWALAWEMADRFKAYQQQAIAVEKDKAIVSLSKQVAHDIRSPLSTLNVVLSTLDNSLPHEQKELIENSVNRINQIADDLLNNAKSRSERYQSTQANGHSQLDQIISNIAKEKEAQGLVGNKIQLSLDLDAKLVSTNINDGDIGRILSNILNNAIESIESVGEVRVNLRYFDKLALISIMDNGIGIPDHILEVLGSREISFGKQDSKAAGNGLGIFHARKTLESAGGTLAIQSKIGVGTNIEIRIPLVDD